MKVHFGQVYIKPGIDFPFSHHFQRRLAQEVTALVEPSLTFINKYGCDSKLMFNVSAKQGIKDNEIKGPTIFKKTKNIEYTVFLPFDVIIRQAEVPQTALRYLLRGACSVFESLDIGTEKVVEKQESLIEQICSDPMMFEDESNKGDSERRHSV
jgi:hypothetical protein